MNCPACNGTGRVDDTYIEPGYAMIGWKPCDYPGCVNGIVNCCEPDNDGLPKGESDGHD